VLGVTASIAGVSTSAEQRATPSVKSAERALDLLEYVTAHPGITMREIRDDLGLPRSSLHGLLAVLERRGFLERDLDGAYTVGLHAFMVGAAWQSSVDLTKAADPVLRTLVARVDQIAHVGVLDGLDVVYILKHENRQPVRLVSAVGARLPAHATALGKVLLGALPETEARARLEGAELTRLTPATIVDRAELLAASVRARELGYAIDAGESTPGVCCYAAPIRDLRGEVVAALSTSVLESRGPAMTPDEYVEAVTDAGREVSARLGAFTERPTAPLP
jgi:DNA-binding IclR family transcriptional regulator